MVENQELDQQDVVDIKLFEFLTETDPEVLKRLTPTVSEEEKDRFLTSDFSINPTITYPSLINAQDELDLKRKQLLNAGFLIQAYIDSRSLSIQEREALLSYYRSFVKRRFEIFDLLSSAANGDFDELDRITERLYGNPSIVIFNTYLKNIYEDTGKALANPMLSSLVSEVRAVLPIGGKEVLEAEEINLEPFKTYLKPQMESVRDILSEYKDTDILDINLVKESFEKALESINAKSWTVVSSTKYKTITVQGDQKIINIPTDREVSKQKLLGLVAHEVFTHVQRREASKTVFPYEILRTGLDGYLEGEEAIATFSEAAFNPSIKLRLDGGDMHFATCLALGLDGHKRDFKEVFKILYLIKKFNNIIKGEDIEKADEKAKRSAWKTTLRVFRGTPGNIPGVCFRKDLVYGEGRLQLFKYLQTFGNSNISDLWKAKYSPWDPTHMEVLAKYR